MRDTRHEEWEKELISREKREDDREAGTEDNREAELLRGEHDREA